MKDGMGKAKLFWELQRPFTLVMPALGIVSGAVAAYGAAPRFVCVEASLRIGLWRKKAGISKT
jgi:1,4-dihydroxy-2-naphthoate octaprenyltransferase